MRRLPRPRGSTVPRSQRSRSPRAAAAASRATAARRPPTHRRRPPTAERRPPRRRPRQGARSRPRQNAKRRQEDPRRQQRHDAVRLGQRQDGRASPSCTGACATAWPPLYATGTPTYGTGLTGIDVLDGHGAERQKQLAVNGKPLYLWTDDKKAGRRDRPGRERLLRRRRRRQEGRQRLTNRAASGESLPRLDPLSGSTRQPSGKKSDTMRSSTTGAPSRSVQRVWKYVTSIGPRRASRAIGCDVRSRPSSTSPTRDRRGDT